MCYALYIDVIVMHFGLWAPLRRQYPDYNLAGKKLHQTSNCPGFAEFARRGGKMDAAAGRQWFCTVTV